MMRRSAKPFFARCDRGAVLQDRQRLVVHLLRLLMVDLTVQLPPVARLALDAVVALERRQTVSPALGLDA
jgi:hypothetical protein